MKVMREGNGFPLWAVLPSLSSRHGRTCKVVTTNLWIIFCDAGWLMKMFNAFTSIEETIMILGLCSDEGRVKVN